MCAPAIIIIIMISFDIRSANVFIKSLGRRPCIAIAAAIKIKCLATAAGAIHWQQPGEYSWRAAFDFFHIFSLFFRFILSRIFINWIRSARIHVIHRRPNGRKFSMDFLLRSRIAHINHICMCAPEAVVNRKLFHRIIGKRSGGYMIRGRAFTTERRHRQCARNEFERNLYDI